VCSVHLRVHTRVCVRVHARAPYACVCARDIVCVRVCMCPCVYVHVHVTVYCDKYGTSTSASQYPSPTMPVLLDWSSLYMLVDRKTVSVPVRSYMVTWVRAWGAHDQGI
jgi:hypothetical protein